jgi:hypothetical protein
MSQSGPIQKPDKGSSLPAPLRDYDKYDPDSVWLDRIMEAFDDKPLVPAQKKSPT